MNKVKVIKIDKNKLLGAKNKEEALKNILLQAIEETACNCEECKQVPAEKEGTPEDFLKFLSRLNSEDAGIDSEECDCELCSGENDTLQEGFLDFLNMIQNKTKESSRNDEYKTEEKFMKNNIKEDKKNNDYSFTEMIEEFCKGYTGVFSDGQDLFTFMEGTLLYKTEVGSFPVSLTGELLRSRFFKKQILISCSEALELATEGHTPNFKVELYGRTYTGHLTMKNGVPSYKINGDIIGTSEALILGALMTGNWYL